MVKGFQSVLNLSSRLVRFCLIYFFLKHLQGAWHLYHKKGNGYSILDHNCLNSWKKKQQANKQTKALTSHQKAGCQSVQVPVTP